MVPLLPLLAPVALSAPPRPTRACREQLAAELAVAQVEMQDAWLPISVLEHPDVLCAEAQRFLERSSQPVAHCEDRRGLHLRQAELSARDEAAAVLERLGGCWDVHSSALDALREAPFRVCFEASYAAGELPGRIDLRVEIGSDGAATSEVLQDGHDALERCLADAVAHQALPESSWGTYLCYPLVIER